VGRDDGVPPSVLIGRQRVHHHRIADQVDVLAGVCPMLWARPSHIESSRPRLIDLESLRRA